MDLARARYLVSAAGRADLEAESLSAAPPGVVERSAQLRRRHPPDAAAALGEQLALRKRAAERGLPVEGWLFTAAGQQMMTHPRVAARRATRMARYGRPVLDVTAGLGGDLRALTDAGLEAFGLEHDVATALLASANVPAARVAVGDAAAPPVRLDGAMLFMDPGRREGGSRKFDPAAFAPPWERCLELAGMAAGTAIKTSPGIDDRYLPAPAEVEFVQLGRTLREATVWLGADARPGLRRAVMLPAGACLDSEAAECDPDPAPLAPYLFDPEGCVTRASLVRQLAAKLRGRLIDPYLAYITLDRPAFSPFGTTFEVIEALPFSVRRLRDLLRARRWRPDEIRRRAFPVEPDELRRLLRMPEGEPLTLICTTLAGRRTVLVARRLVDETAGQ